MRIGARYTLPADAISGKPDCADPRSGRVLWCRKTSCIHRNEEMRVRSLQTSRVADGRPGMTTRPGHGRWRLLAAGLAIAVCATDAMALFIVTEPWVRPATNARSAEAFMELTSTEGATLVGIHSESAPGIGMRGPGIPGVTLKSIALPAGRKVMLAPRGYRLAIAGLEQPLRLGDHFAIVLIVMAADGIRREYPVNAEIRSNSPTYDHQHGHAH
jgi:periplasmic copper chaperone A